MEVCWMVMEYSNMLMEPLMKVSILMEFNKVMENSKLKMEKPMKVILEIINCMEKDCIDGLLDISIMEIGIMINDMVMESLNGVVLGRKAYLNMVSLLAEMTSLILSLFDS
jgi:hypothetical protein